MFPALIALLACSNQAPSLLDVPSQQASVGVQLTFEVIGADANGDALSWSLASESLPDIATRSAPATLTPFDDGQSAFFRWTPLVSDVGEHTLVVTADDGRASSSVPVPVTVSTGAAVPVFREPLGDGTTLDLRETDCVSVDVVVEDGDGSDVSLYLEEPVEENFDFDQDQPMAGVFEFCPSVKQIDAADRYAVTFVAEDRDGNVALKKYTIVLRKELLSGCPGEAPQISHTPPGSATTVLDPVIEATVSDDVGVAGMPVLYFSPTAPSDPANPDFSTFTQIDMTRDSGTAQSGSYSALLPNPVLSEPVGTTRSLYYFIEAADNDDEAGPCDHRATAPDADVWELAVERPETSDGLGSCEPCTADVQCNSGRCIATGGGETQCLDACDADPASCGGGTTCSDVAWSSVDGAIGNVCLPDDGTCGDTCVADAFEDNDTIDDPGVDDLSDGIYTDLSVCPDGQGGVDEDYYGLLLGDATPMLASIWFTHADGDLDLQLLDDDGDSIDASTGVDDVEWIDRCLDPGLYFLRVFSPQPTVNTTYELDVELPVGGCCANDDGEPDDDRFDAQIVFPGDGAEGSVCPGDEDWFEIDLFAGETLEVTLLFDQAGPENDLDLHFHDSAGTDLTPCPPCDIDNGQSGTADEYFETPIDSTDTYYVVVRGFDGASADYLIGFDVR